MSDLPSQQLLDEMHSFPGRFVFKAIGRTDNGFESRVVAAVREVLAKDVDAPYEIRTTSGGRHVSVTIEPWVESSVQVIDIFAAIRSVEGLVMLM